LVGHIPLEDGILGSSPSSAANSAYMDKYIISSDNSVTARVLKFFTNEPDDSIALAVLLQAHREKEIEILGITSTFGNTDGNTSYGISKKQVQLSGLNIPVIKGAIKKRQTDSQAVSFIIESLEKAKERITLVALGPVTDYAAVFKAKPSLLAKVKEFFFVRSGPYINQNKWYLCSFNAFPDIGAAEYMHSLGGNKYKMGKEIFNVGINNDVVKELQSIGNPMMKFITKDLLKWNFQNKFILNKGYFSRKGDMCPWDLVWSMYLVEPSLYRVEIVDNIKILHVIDREMFLSRVLGKLRRWGN